MKKINLYKIVSFSYKSRIFLAYVLPLLSLKSGSVLVCFTATLTTLMFEFLF